jgi:hypothetical protein
MATFGRSVTTGNNQFYQNLGSNNQVATLFTAPEDGLITDLAAYCSGDGASADCVLCLWSSSGALLASTDHITAPSGSRSINGQGWVTGPLTTPYSMTGGTSYYIGFWRKPSDSFVYSSKTGSGTTHKQGVGTTVSSATTLGTYTGDGSEQIGAYATYSVGGAYVKQGGGTMTRRIVYVKQGDGSWLQRVVYVKQGDGSWRQAG